jgi:hypothetical protein
MKKISFVNILEIDPRYNPVPSSTIVPKWYKNINPYALGKKDPNFMTVKRCVPVFDAITSGYTILLPADIFVHFEYRDNQRFQVVQASHLLSFSMIQTHSPMQFSTYPGVQKDAPAQKLVNPFSIITPPGYSCLFTQPMHQDDTPIKAFEGIVDTDKQHIVNFPFVLKDPNFEGLITAGTPIVQIIPFKREAWQMEINKKTDKKKTDSFMKHIGAQLFNQYRDFFWTRKEYK